MPRLMPGMPGDVGYPRQRHEPPEIVVVLTRQNRRAIRVMEKQSAVVRLIF